jgi:hypothetical protein
VALRRPGHGDHRRRWRRGCTPDHHTTLLRGFSESRIPDFVVTDFEHYSGIACSDVGFAEAAATIGAQTALST